MIPAFIKKIESHSQLRFITEISLLAFASRFIIVLPIVIILSILGVNLGTPNITGLQVSMNNLLELVYIIIIAPFIETILFQLLPIRILEAIKINKLISSGTGVIIVLTTLIFAFAHLHEGLINFIGMLPIGFLLAWSFTLKKKRSLKLALVVVFIIHAITNFSAVLLYKFVK